MLHIKGGKVYDPANNVHGDVRDVCIADGRIVAEVDGGRTIDATGMVVFPGGVDIHTHVAGAAINFARAMTPEDHRKAHPFLHTPLNRAGLGGATPTTFATGYLYAGMGWTTVIEAAVPVLTAKHTHEELRDTPIVDKGCFLLMANNEIVLDLLEAGETERAKQVVAWLLGAAKVYGVKAVNPGGVAAWKWGKDAKTLGDPVEGYSKVTPAKIIAGLARIVDELRLPHPLHIHCNNLGNPGNYTTTLETMKRLEGNRAHMAHLQFHAYGGADWHSIRSEAAAIAEYFNAHPNLTADAGAILFGDAVTITADGPWQHLLYQLTGRKWGNLDVENETGCGIVPYTYRPSNLVNAVQWAVGLELLLLINDPWRIFLTTDHPNGGCFWRYPEIIHLLMNADFRRERLQKLPAKALKRTVLGDLDRQYTLSEIAIITSAGPARALGLVNKGHLGAGADADVTIYNDDPDPSRMFGYPRYVVKGGEVVLEEGEIRKTPQGREFLVQPAYDPAIEEYMRPVFQQYYTMSFDNYPVEMERIQQSQIVDCAVPTAT
jgi:formylmethanofuran dehydrogenase subunit A